MLGSFPLSSAGRDRRAQSPYGPSRPDWRYRKKRSPHEPVTNPLPEGESPTTDEDLRVLEPPQEGFVEPGGGNIPDADADERINYPQDPQRELKDHTPEDPRYTRHQDFLPDITSPDDRPLHRPKRTHTVYDSQQDELMLESDEDNNFVGTTYPYTTSLRLSSALGPVRAMSRWAILRMCQAVDEDPVILDLIKRFKQGDLDAGDELVQRYGGLLREVVKRHAYQFGRPLFDPQQIDDLAQEATVGMLNALQRYDGRAKLSTYLWAVAEGSVRNEIRVIRRHRAREPFAEELTKGPGAVEDAPSALEPTRPRAFEDVLRELQLSLNLDQILERLPASMQATKEIFKQQFIQGKPLNRIADELGIPQSTLYRRTQKILRWLRTQPEVQELASRARKNADRRRSSSVGRAGPRIGRAVASAW